MARVVYVYAGPGTDPASIIQTVGTFSSLPLSVDSIRKIGHEKICTGEWVADGALIVMPEGADRLYAQYLSGAGNQCIRTFVAQGGRFRFLCWGLLWNGKNFLYPENTCRNNRPQRVGLLPWAAGGACSRPL